MAYKSAQTIEALLDQYARRLWLDARRIARVPEREAVARVRAVLDQVFEMGEDESIAWEIAEHKRACRVLLAVDENELPMEE